MKLKNYIIKNLVDNGLENTTDHDLSAAHAYKVFKFRDEVAKANKEVDEKRVKLVKDIIGDGGEFEKKRDELSKLAERTEEQQKELDGLNAKLTKFNELYVELMNDESELNVKTIPFEEYHLLARENKKTPVMTGGKEAYIDFFTVFRSVLKGILWEEPVED